MREFSVKSRGGRLLSLFSLFLFAFLVAYFSGRTFFLVEDSLATSANIVISDSDQSFSLDQATTAATITKTSTVTVTNITATVGYTLTARIAQNTIGATVTIGSTSSLACPLLTPCPLSSTAENILTTSDGSAVSGETTTWEVKITVPASTALGTYTLDIEYDEDANAPSFAITSVLPATNWNNGDIYITGTGFVDVTGITVGGTACLSYKIISTTSASCVLPAKSTGTVNAVILTSSTYGASNNDKTVTYDSANKGFMQTFTGTTCSAMPMGKVEQWTDARDNKQYRVKKMLDDKCWMIDNLAYAGGGTDTYSDVQSLVFANATSTSAWNISTGTTTRFVTTNNHTGSDKLDRNGNNIQNTTATMNNVTSCTTSPTGSGAMQSECLSYLYNWCAAVGLDSGTAPTCAGVYAGGSGTGYATQGVIGATGGQGGESKGSGGTSICPTNWRLPVGRVGGDDNSMNEWAILNGSMRNNTHKSTPDITEDTGWFENWQPTGSFTSIGAGNFAPMGSGSGSGLNAQSASATYWSSSMAGSATNAAFMSVSATSVLPGTNSYNKNIGIEVRCVLSD